MKFELKHRDSLSIEDFVNHSIWVQYYSADEIQHIVNEGYAIDDVKKKLAEIEWSDEFWFKSFPSNKTNPYMFTRYKAEFKLPNSKVINGYIESTEYNGIQNYNLYVDGDFISLNIHHPDLNEETEAELKSKLNLTELYPLTVRCYEGLLINEKYNPKKEDNTI